MPDSSIRRRACAAACLLLAFGHPHAAFAVHALSLGSTPKYPAGFANFEWVNPHAPKGGELRLGPPTRSTNFYKYNPFTFKGPAPPRLTSLGFEALLTGTMDEPTPGYGWLAGGIAGAPGQLSGT